MTTKKVQDGWDFKGVNIISNGYSKIHFFPGNISAVIDQRGWYKEVKPERAEDVAAEHIRYDFNEGDPIPDIFEVLVVTRLDDKIVRTEILQPKPHYIEQEEETMIDILEEN